MSLAVRPAPKPEPRKKGKRVKRGICVQCGTIWKGEPEHSDTCAKELPLIKGTKYMSEANWLEEALDELCRLITIWRDGCVCVINTSECWGGSQWGHVIPQGSNSFLKHELGNSFRQCAGHNLMHGKRELQLPYFNWYRRTFGNKAMDALDAARLEYPTYSWTPAEMRERLVHYNDLYDTRFIHGNSSLAEKIAAGFYGEIIKEAWIKEGRI